ncbi:MAG: class I SAM-dependent methyltransferase [Bacteroidetes bacterium]|nr:class I SAM-dependent methyltransferase [Bacteroidota bacterium]
MQLKYADGSFGSAIAFYAIVHFDYEQVRKALSEVKRVLSHNGEFLFSFHIGNETVCLDKFLDKDVKIKFQFFEVDKIKTIVEEVGLTIIDIIKRQPYKNRTSNRKSIYLDKKQPIASVWQNSGICT